MKKYLYGLVVIVVVAVAGCTPPAVVQEASQPQRPSVTHEIGELALRMSQLPGAELLAAAAQTTVGYPEGTLFTRDSVLPLPGGSAMLEPLVTLLKEFPEQHWQLLLAAENGHEPDYAQRLAQQRQVMLQRYLQKRGVVLDRIDFKVDPGGRMPLLLVALPETQESSSAVLNE